MYTNKNIFRFDQANTAAILSKLIEFNKKVEDRNCVVSEEDLLHVIKFGDQVINGYLLPLNY